MKLSDIACKSAKPEETPYKKFDGGGLFLLINPNGSKLWRLKYRYLGKEKLLSLGSYPIVTLADAREARADAKKLLAQNPPIDPMTHKNELRHNAIRDAENTFKAVALEWLELNEDSWSDNYYLKMKKGLELNVFPYIGNRPIKAITPPELLKECLKRIESRGSLDIAARTRQICGQVFRYAIQIGKCDWNPAENLRGALKPHKKEHFRAMDIKQIPKFINTLERNEARLFERTRRAVWLSLYTFLRPKEIRQARWKDIDFEAAEWSIPAPDMKMRRAHIVPLSKQAIAVLRAQQKEVEVLNTDWVFPSQVRPKNPMSDGTVNKAIKRLGFGEEAVAHGFRALARTTIREKLKYDSEIIEKQLSHKTKNPLGEAYDRTQFLEDRHVMMQDWANYLDKIGQNNA